MTASLVLGSSCAAADEPAYQLTLELDLPLLLVAAAGTSGFLFLDESGAGPACGTPCDPARVNAFDRPAAGLYDPRWSSVGDVATFTTIAIPPLLVLLDDGWENGLNDDLVLVESLLVSAALQVSLSYAVARPRPRVYGTEAPLDERDDANAARSFYSGHVAEAMAVSVAGMRTFHRRGKRAAGWAVLGVGTAGSTLIAVSRVASGGHFPSDVLIGAAAGTGVGLAVPALHASPVRVVPMAAAGGGGITVGGELD